MNGADPTLEGCTEFMGERPDAFRAAEQCGKDKLGRDLVNQMLAAVKPFWIPAEYCKANYDKTRVSQGFPNWPKDFEVMRDVLRDVWAKAEDEKLLDPTQQIAMDVNANLPKPLEGKVDCELRAAMDQMSINVGEGQDGQAQHDNLGAHVKADFSGRRNILP